MEIYDQFIIVCASKCSVYAAFPVVVLVCVGPDTCNDG